MKRVFVLIPLSVMLMSCAHVTQQIDMKKEQNTEGSVKNNLHYQETRKQNIEEMHYGPVPSGRF